ncbi:MAG: bifunctional phosphoserine phosphatase/homoserine phosphotransferase ThrH [Alphaproteobacteria bacterium]|nr:bifunctional phosphoserine phosphatase/homoserine phosphotransferase ThrH [Alphaproteobacteria bacterium]
MQFVCLDFEGVLVPEIWIAVAERTGIAELRLTTRDEPDYDLLMQRRLAILNAHRIRLSDIQMVIAGLEPMEGARAFLDTLRARYQVAILSDTFYEFAAPLARRLGWPTMFCHALEVASDGRITGYRLRLADHKRRTVRALLDLNFQVFAAGDSYNDTAMLGEADLGILFRAPENVRREFPALPHVAEYDALLDRFAGAAR